jgi:WhiB family redox-sensing transcriptional regulator
MTDDELLAGLAVLLEDEAWKRDALCLEHTSTADWFPERGDDVRPAKAVCGRCSVAGECLDYAIGNDVKHGIWGGLSERERRRARRDRKLAA